MKKAKAVRVHPQGEETFVFPTAGGTVHLSMSTDALTPYGGIVPWSAFVRRCGILEELAKSCPVERTSPNAAPVYDVVQSFALTALCDGRRFAHVNRMRQDPTVCELLGIKTVVGDDTIRRFFASLEPASSARWVAAAAAPIWEALPEHLILDWDSTVQSKYGHQQGAEVGYNPRKPGRRSFHPLLAVAAGTRMCPYYGFRAGNTVTSTRWEEAMEECQRWLGGRKVWLNRGDIGLGQEKVMAWHEKRPGRPHFLFKLKLTTNVRRAISAVPEAGWQGPPQRGVLQVAEGKLQLAGWSRERRVVFARRLLGSVPKEKSGTFWDENQHEFEAYVTDLGPAAASAWQIVELYRKRADAENVFDELKNQWGFDGFASRKRAVSELAARLLLLVYNLWNLFLRLMSPEHHIEAARGRRWFLLIAARLVRSGRQRTLQICAAGAWWDQLKEGYQRLCRWLEATAPQLGKPPGGLPDFSPLKPSSIGFNCGN